MTKKLCIILLVLSCLSILTGCCSHAWSDATCEDPQICSKCEEVQGDPLGHDMADADCVNPRTCIRCGLTEGTALGHTWQEATTELPKTCTVCAATEGERIITDPRFTTASTAALQGDWQCIVDMNGADMGMEDFPGILQVALLMNFGNAGAISIDIDFLNTDAFLEEALDYSVELVYAAAEAEGTSREEVDDLIYQNFQMSTKEYVRSELDADGTFSAEYFNALLASAKFNGVYYVEGNIIYTGTDWDSVTGDPFVLEGDTLQIDALSEGLGKELLFTRAAE